MNLIEKAEQRGFLYELVQGDKKTEICALCYDSRKVTKGCLFVCMKGAAFDSHEILSDVAKSGASAAVIDRTCELPEGIAIFRVPDARRALAELSAAWFDFPADHLITVGVTGTKGKTTVTHMIKTLLEKAGKKTGLIGTNGITVLNRHTETKNTTPESYEIQESFAEMVKAGCSCVVMEVSSQGLMLHRTHGISFDYAVFTNISPDHIGPSEHKSFSEYLDCKARLFSQCKVGILNEGDAHADFIRKKAACDRLYSFGTCKEADFLAENIQYSAEKGFLGLEFTFSAFGGEKTKMRVGIPGQFNADNALAAFAVCDLMGISRSVLSNGLEDIRVNGRMEIIYSGCFTVMVDYAHNAVSMEALLNTLRDYHPKRLIVLFGCGGNRAKERRFSMGEIAGRKADFSVLTADNSRYEKVEDILSDIRASIVKTGGNFTEIADRKEAIFYAIRNASPGDMIAIIGKGHEDYQEINGIRHHFSDRETAEEALKACGYRREEEVSC